MEIYRQTLGTATFDAPANDTTVWATASLNGGEDLNLTVTAEVDSTLRTVSIPFVTYDGEVKVSWSFAAPTFDGTDIVTVEDTYQVVTPLLTTREILEIHPNATAEEIVRIEKAVRHIINAHCGQEFGFWSGNIRVRGQGTDALMLPRRIVDLVEVNDTAVASNYLIASDGWTLHHFPWGVPPLKADYYGLHYTTGGVIHNPNNVRYGTWDSELYYNISGLWGWREVPDQVKEAAKLLVNDYACADQAYRDRYLTSMTAADWRIQYHSGAFRFTGNVRADQLLSDYVALGGWAVI